MSSERGQLVFRYADRMCQLSQEIPDIVNARKEASLLFDVGVADVLSRHAVKLSDEEKAQHTMSMDAIF